MQPGNTRNFLPEPTIRRYPIYLREIRAMIAHGAKNVSGAVLAEKLGLDSVLTRKDLAMVGIPGKPRLGYPAQALEAAMMRAIGWDNVNDAVLIGAGSLGQALLGYTGFKDHNLSITSAFDSDPGKIGQSFHGITVHPIEKLPEFVKQFNLKLGILTVPQCAAQDCTDKLVAAGIAGIWNFTPVLLRVPPGIAVQNVDLAQSLAVLSHTTALALTTAKNGLN